MDYQSELRPVSKSLQAEVNALTNVLQNRALVETTPRQIADIQCLEALDPVVKLFGLQFHLHPCKDATVELSVPRKLPDLLTAFRLINEQCAQRSDRQDAAISSEAIRAIVSWHTEAQEESSGVEIISQRVDICASEIDLHGHSYQKQSEKHFIAGTQFARPDDLLLAVGLTYLQTGENLLKWCTSRTSAQHLAVRFSGGPGINSGAEFVVTALDAQSWIGGSRAQILETSTSNKDTYLESHDESPLLSAAISGR